MTSLQDLQARVDRLDPQQRRKLATLLAATGKSALRREPCPLASLSLPQRRLWVLARLGGDLGAYNIPGVFALRGRLEVAALQRAFQRMAERHEILRTTFDTDAHGDAMQCIGTEARLDWQVADLSADPSEAAQQTFSEALVAAPLDLEKGPCWRVALANLGAHRYLLAMSFHHIVFDGWSLGLFTRELFAFYGEEVGDSTEPVAPPKYQYSDYVNWQRTQFDALARAREIDYWTEQLSGHLPRLELPTDRPHPQRPSFRGGLVKHLIPLSLFKRVKQLARQHDATPYAVFLATYVALIHRLSGQNELIVGTPVSGRSEQDIEAMIGVFVNTLPIRIAIESGQTLGALIERVRDVSLDAFSYATLPFDEIVQALNPERIPGRNPVFQTLYTYQNAIAPIKTADLAIQYLDIDQGSAKFDLSLDVVEGPQGPSCLWEYSRDLYDRKRVERMAEQFERLLAGAVEQPQLPIARLPLLNATERALACASLAQPVHALPVADFVSLFEQRVREQPEALAIRDQGRSVDYAELNATANRLARTLQAKGVVADRPIGIALERGAALFETILATLKLGASFVALDPAHPRQRLAFVISDADVQCLVSERRHASAVDEIDIPVFWRDEEIAATLSPTNLGTTVSADALAYIVYTSGTTGQPKGVSITHRNMLNAYLGWRDAYRLDRLRVHLQMAACSFDVFCGDLIRALGSGGALVVCPPTLLAEPDRLLALIEVEGVQCAEFVPTVFRSLATHLERQQQRLHMQLVIVASDHWYVSEYKRFRALLPESARLINSYGVAEATIDSTWFDGDLEDISDCPGGTLVPIGRPFPNVEIFVLGAELQLMPPGVPGEICIGGLGVGQAYLKRPELTAQKFVPHPFDQGKSAYLYRTGDMGRLREDGCLELLGRQDTQVKLNGMRIELGEIEVALKQIEGVSQAAAMVREDEPDCPRLVGYIVCTTDSPDLTAIEAALAERLPTYMVPKAYVVLASLPLSANGKVDRQRLPAPEKNLGSRTRGFVSPRTLNEEMLATLFAQVFGLSRVGVYDDFFELGGHSLLALQIVARVREAFGVDLALRTLFDSPTIAGLAQAISELQGQGAAYDETVNGIPRIEPDPARLGEPFPLTEVQQAYWLGRNDVFEFGNVTTHSYDEMETFDLDRERFQRAWNKVVARHAMLRAVILPDGTQRILDYIPCYEIVELDLRGCAPAEVERGIEGVRAEMSHQQLDVHRWPVFDVRLTRLDGERVRIHFSSDALIFDVWSFVIIIEDLVRAYLDESLVLEPLELSFRDYVLAEQGMRDTPRYQRALTYWRERVRDLPPAPELPMAMDPSELPQPKFTRLHAELDPVRWERLKLKTVRAGLTTTGLMLAAYAEVLAVFSRDPAFSLNLTFLNRHPLHPQVNEIVGEFTSLTMLSVDMHRDACFIDRARRVQGDLWNDLEHHAISGVQVLRDLTRATGGATRAKMPVVFTSALVVPIPKRNPSMPIVPVYRDGVTQTSQVWLDCGVWEDNHVLLCNWDVVLELYPKGLIDKMFACYWKLVTRLAEDDEAWHAPLTSLVPSSEPRAEFAHGLNPLPVTENTLATLFDKSLLRTPSAPAVFAGETVLSYTQLAQYAATVAEAIGSQGKYGELVAVAMHKGWEQVAAVLGIVHTPCAYMPIDPSLPDERIAELLRDGRVRTLVTTADLSERLASLAQVRTLIMGADALADIIGLQQAASASATDLAYTIFTSGSTGKPKGVMIDHRGAVNTIVDLIDRWSLDARLRVLAISSLSFDLSVFDIFGPLAAGGAIVIPEHQRRLDPTHWLELLQKHQVTLWNSVPALCGLLMDHVAQTETQLPALERVMLSGDWIPVPLPDRIREYCPAARVTSLGGATEASIWSVLYEIDAVDPNWRSVPYGQAMRNQRIEVFNAHLEPCPDWVVGKIHIGGVGLAQGYWDDQSKTEAAFIQREDGERWYCTGDIGRRLPDGNIEFLGRNDTQVKVQGYRIELGEIESTIASHPAVAEGVAVAIGKRHSEKRLAGFFVLRPAAELEPGELRQWLQDRLPEYMVPTILQSIASIPLTDNGKVNRKALPISTGLESIAVAPQVPPRDSWELRVAAIWQDILGIESVGVFDDFFAAGGDSMQAIMLLGRLRHQFDVDYQLREIFLEPTVAAQASRARPASGCEGAFDKSIGNRHAI